VDEEAVAKTWDDVWKRNCVRTRTDTSLDEKFGQVSKAGTKNVFSLLLTWCKPWSRYGALEDMLKMRSRKSGPQFYAPGQVVHIGTFVVPNT
jgi:hypothetical protein